MLLFIHMIFSPHPSARLNVFFKELSSIFNKGSLRFNERTAVLILWLFISAYVLVLGTVSAGTYYLFMFYDYDLAHMAQTIWSILHGNIYCSIAGVDFLENHAHLILYLIAPIYAVWPSPVNLLFLQTLALGLSAYPLFLVARKYLGIRTSLFTAFLYLIYPGTAFTNLFEAHVTPFATLFLAWGIYYFITGHFPRFALCAGLAMLCQENIPLIVMSMGIMAPLVGRRGRWIWAPMICGAVYFLFCTQWLLPHFSAGKLDHFILYRYLGDNYSEVIRNLVTHPIETWNLLTSSSRMNYLFLVFAPLLFIPLIGFRGLIPIFLIFLQHMLSSREFDRRLDFYYMAEMLPFIFFGFILGLSWLKRFPKYFIFAICLSGTLSLTAFWAGPGFKILAATQWEKYVHSAALKSEALARIPKDAPVLASFRFLPHLANREDVHSFHHVYAGVYSLSTAPYILPSNVTWALVDFNEPMLFGRHSDHRALERFLADGWDPVEAWASVVLFRKDHQQKKITLYELLPELPEPQHKMHAQIAPGVTFAGYDNFSADGHTLKLSLYWQANGPATADKGRIFRISQPGVPSKIFTVPINYRIYPTPAWQKGDWIKEYVYLHGINTQDIRHLKIEMAFFDFHVPEITSSYLELR